MTRDQRLVLLIAVLASFVSFLDGTIVNVALKAIRQELGGGVATQQWTVDGYLVTLGALILVAGSISDVWGRILVLRIGVIGFGLTSLAIAVAPSAEFLIVARLVQGVAGALLVPSSLALITANFRGAAQSRAIGIWTAATTGATIIGPVLGGLFVDHLSWRWAFAINVVPIAAVLILLVVLGHENNRKPGATIDWLGAALCTVGLGLIVFALIESERDGWGSPRILIPAIVGVLAFAGFIVRQATAKQPMMPLSLFRARNFWSGNLATFFIYGALSLGMFVLAVYLQQGAGLTATLAGLAQLPATIIVVLLSSRIGALSGRFGPRFFMTVGPITMGVASIGYLLIGDPFDYWWQLLPPTILFGLGIALTVAPLTSAILGAIEPERSGIASAINNAVSRVGGLIAVALLGVLVGDTLDLEAVHRMAIVTGVMLIGGGVISLLGIRNPRGDADQPGASQTDAAGAAPASGPAPAGGTASQGG